MKRTTIFKDADRNKVIFECEITNRNGYPEFTASGEYCGGLGQVFDHVKPSTDNQGKLIDLWRKWHLNGMKAGTDRQMTITKGLSYDEAMRKLTAIDRATGKESFFDYDNLQKVIAKYKEELKTIDKWFINASCSVDDIERSEYYKTKRAGYLKELNDAEDALKSTLLYDVDPRDGSKLYKYGSAWLREDLPEDFENTLNSLLDEIETEEEEGKEREITTDDIDLFSDFDEPETALAIALMFGLCVNEVEDIEHNGGYYWTVQGIDYLAGTDDEMDDAWDEELERYIDECMEIPESMERYFDREAWKSDARYDGRGHALNRYDGGEEEIKVNGVYYYAYRQ